MSKLRIKALTFDVTNTIIKAHPSIGHQYANAARVHGITAESAALDRVFEATMALKKLEQPDYGKHHGISGQDWWKDVVGRVFTNAGFTIACSNTLSKVSNTLWQHFQENARDAWEVLPNTREGLDALHFKGFRLGVVSNFDSTLACTLRAHNLYKYFDFVLSSEESGTSKPNPEIFRKALLKFVGGALCPGEVAHVGDEILNDYMAARNVGMTSFLIDHEGHIETADLDHVVDRKHVVRDLRDLLRLV